MYSALLRRMFGTRLRAVATVILWVLIAGVLAQIAPSLDDVENNTSGNLPSAISESMQARALAAEVFPDRSGTPGVIVVRGDDVEDVDSALTRIGDELAGPSRPDLVTEFVSAQTRPVAAPGLVSADGLSQMAVVTIEGNAAEESFQDAVAHVREIVAAQAGETEAAVTGPAGISTDTVKVFSSGDKLLLLGTIVLVLLILLVIYRSPLLALIPLLGVGVAMRVAEGLGAMMADAGWFDINSQTASIMTVLLFGVGTDYALIITARYREALREEPDRQLAMQSAMRGVGEVLISSASTVVLAMLALLVAVSPALRGFGPYLALGVASMAVVAFTFIPAMILVFGDKVFWPLSVERAAARSQGGRIWQRAADWVIYAPVKVIVAALAVLMVMSLGLLGYKQSFDFISGFRIDTESARGQSLVAEGFGSGEIAPSTLYITTDATAPGADQWAAVSNEVAEHDGVARVGAPPRVSEDGRTAAFEVILEQDPYSQAALDSIAPIRHAGAAATESAGISDATALVGGETSQAADTQRDLDRDTMLIIIVVLALVALVLGLLLRSVLAPLYLVGTLVLSFFATLGVTTFVTVTVLGDAGIGNRVTAYIFVFLVALGVDYNIFIMGRYREEVQFRPPADALREAIVRTGGVVSSAGLILAATFSVLMTQPIRELFQFGFAMAFGVLLDTFVIRPLLVPAIVRMLGDRALWPSTPGAKTRDTLPAEAAPETVTVGIADRLDTAQKDGPR